LIHFDLEDRYQDEHVVGNAITRLDRVVLSVVVHTLVLLAFLFGPRLLLLTKSQADLERERQAQIEQQRERDDRTMVFVSPRVDIPAPKPPLRADLSDLDRKAQTKERAPEPKNPLPFSRGNSAERTERAESQQAKGEKTPEPKPEPPKPEQQIARNLPPATTGLPSATPDARPRPSGSLGDALRNLQQYVQNQTFDNPQGGENQPGSEIQFDTKGVEFGPWLRRFVAQVRRNWFVPEAAMTFHGRVVLQFNIHKSGRITDIVVLQPSDIQSFTVAAVNAIKGSNPTEPLPPEYPDEKALFTVTFYYNEDPGRAQ
jgi:TonB family protein